MRLSDWYAVDDQNHFYCIILLISKVGLMTGNNYVKEIKLWLEKVYKVDLYSE